MRIISYFLLLLVIIFGITFALLNAETVTIHYYVGQATMPLAFLLVCIFSAGCIIGVLVSLGLLFKVRFENRRLRQRLQLAEKEIANLRTIPFLDKV